MTKKKYNPKDAFNDKSLPKKTNTLDADKEEELERSAAPLIRSAIDKLYRTSPELFRDTIRIHPAFNKSEIARRYYKKATGEALTNQEAVNRWRNIRNPDKKILAQVVEEVTQEQKTLITKNNMETIRITTGTYNTSDFRVVKEYKSRGAAQKFMNQMGCRSEIFNGLQFSKAGTNYTVSIG